MNSSSSIQSVAIYPRNSNNNSGSRESGYEISEKLEDVLQKKLSTIHPSSHNKEIVETYCLCEVIIDMRNVLTPKLVNYAIKIKTSLSKYNIDINTINEAAKKIIEKRFD